jgi:hypothetical protein
MKAHRITVLVMDHEGYGAQNYADMIANLDYCTPYRMETFDIGEWTDEHLLNQQGCDVDAILEGHPVGAGRGPGRSGGAMRAYRVKAQIVVMAHSKEHALELAGEALQHWDLEKDETRLQGCGGAEGSAWVEER